jgi:hypothetical protein
MNCDEIQELLSDLLDDELATGARAGVEAHLASCERCAASYRALRRTVRFVQKVGQAPGAPVGAGRWYSEFTRTLVDETARRTPIDLLLELASADIERIVKEKPEGDAR